MARRFLLIVATLIVLVLIGAIAFRLFATQLMRAAFVPTTGFEEAAAPAGPDYRQPGMWIARPDRPGSPALWTPTGFVDRPDIKASLFFVHPTSFLDKSRWNAPLDDGDSAQRARIFVKSQASAFNGIGAIWAPRYRQATVGAFLSTRPDAEKAIDLAYRDVRAAFDQFLEEAPKDRPIILAAHSQGSYHLARLLRDRIAGTLLAGRIAAAYVAGWPLSMTIDVPKLGLPACRSARDAGCIIAWQSFAEPADPGQLMKIYDASMGPNGRSRAGTPILCVDPLSGTIGGGAPASANLGTLIPTSDLENAAMKVGLVPARCDRRGLLLIGEEPPEMPPYTLPGNNYHVFDYALFWANVRADARRRVEAFVAR